MSRTGLCAILVVGVCLAQALGEGKPVSLLEWAKKSQGRHAYGLYFGKKKAGWSVEEMKVGRHGGKDVLISTSENYTATLFDGEKSVKEEKSVKCYALEGKGEIVFAEVKSKEDGKELTRRVERKGDGLVITTTQGKRTTTRTAGIPKDTLAHQRDLEAWLQGPRKKGDTFTAYASAWEKKNVDDRQIYTFRKTRSAVWEGKPADIYVVQVDIEGGKLDAELFHDGKMLVGRLGDLMTQRLEPEVEAKKMDANPVDLMNVSAVVVDRKLGHAATVDSLTLEVTGLGDFKMPRSHRQASRTENEVTVLELKRDFRVEEGRPLTKAEVKKYLEQTPRIQCDHEAITKQARKIVGDEKDTLKAARKLERWVHRTLKKSYKDNAETALEVFDNKAGDCTEHTLLFVALARAAKIPAREVGGLAYIEGRRPMFGWHAWAEIHDGHQWVSVDPTWGQVYVDATHVKMSEGNSDLAWANVAGKIKMKVTDFKKR